MLDLIDYKGKFEIAQDPSLFCDDPMSIDYKIGEISKKQILSELRNRFELSMYYGVPCYVGNDTEILRELEKLEKEYNLHLKSYD